MGTDDHSAIQTLKIAACVVIVAWGIRTASHVLSIVLLSLLLAYAILPFPLWLVRRFHVPKSAALSLTVLLVIVFYCVLTFALVKTGLQMSARASGLRTADSRPSRADRRLSDTARN